MFSERPGDGEGAGQGPDSRLFGARGGSWLGCFNVCRIPIPAFQVALETSFCEFVHFFPIFNLIGKKLFQTFFS